MKYKLKSNLLMKVIFMQRIKNILNNITRGTCEDYKEFEGIKYSSEDLTYEKYGCLQCAYRGMNSNLCKKKHPTIFIFAALEGRGRDNFMMRRVLDGLIPWID
jgi:hypothetical protein